MVTIGMSWNRFPRLSLTVKIAMATTAIFLIGLWSLALYFMGSLREDMQRLISAQQYSTASYIAIDVDQELNRRFDALEQVAANVSPAMLGNAAALQAFMEQRWALPWLFNGGTSVHALDGTVIADVPLTTGRLGVNFMDVDAVAATLKEGRSAIGRPLMGKALHAPVFGMTVPIRDAKGRVIGALAGVINLGRPNFLDKLTQGTYGESGGYLLIAPQYRMIVTATDRSRIMEALPASGVSPSLDRFIQGYEGSDVLVNTHNAKLLASAKGVPRSGWLALVWLPATEAFAPIQDMLQRRLLATLILTLTAGAVVWWLLRLQLLPMLGAVKQLAAMSDTTSPLHPLPVAEGEIGQLFGGFNRLLEALGRREEALKESEFRWKFALEGTGDGVWDVDLETEESHHSRRYREILGYAEGEFIRRSGGWLDDVHPDDTPYLLGLVQGYVAGRSSSYAAEYRMRCKDGSYKWIHSRGMAVSRGEDGRPLRMIGTITDISERKEEELKLAQVERDLWRALRQVEQKERSKARFLAATSHDLRQPLFAAQLVVDSLALTQLDAHQRTSVGRIQQSLRAMSNELQLLLDLSRLDDPNLQLCKEYQPALLLFEGIDELYRPRAEQANVRLLFHPGEHVLHTDHRLLTRLIGKLIDNAIKFSPGGTVLVCARRGNGGRMIQVRDNGIGMAESEHRAIFEDFYQIGNDERDPRSGFGLGLSIASRIARLLGIKIGVASVPGRGSIFSLVMPN